MKLKNFAIPGATGLVIVLSLVLSIIIKSGAEFKIPLLLAYLLIGLVGFGYSALLEKFKARLPALLFLCFSFLSGLYFFITMSKGPEGLSQLAAFLGWMMLMAVSFVLSLIAFVVLLIMRRKEKKE